jgi:hypothetical protein
LMTYMELFPAHFSVLVKKFTICELCCMVDFGMPRFF